MILKPIEKIEKSDLLSLISDAVIEKKTLEYKEKFSGNSDNDKKELLKDITSFANSSGGDIVYGIKEDHGVPIELIGIPNEEVDSKIRWIEDLTRQGVQPRIPGMRIQPVDVNEDKKVLIVRIPKSWRSPHCVIFQNWSRFFARTSNGVYQLNVDELRSAFILSNTLNEKIQNFKNDRIANILANEIPMQLYSNSIIILHIIPLTSFSITSENIDIKKVFNSQKLSPIHCGAATKRINFDGIILYSEEIEVGKVDTYIQLYKNGIIEIVESSLLSTSDNEKIIPYIDFEDTLIRSVKQYVSFLSVKGYKMKNTSSLYENRYKIERDILSPEVVIFEDRNSEIELLLKPIFDSIWNACGYPHSENYDEDGYFKPNLRM